MRSVIRALMLTLGWLLLIPGLVFVVLPPPFAFGIFMVLPGVAILIAYSKGMRRLIQSIRARFNAVDIALKAVETRVPDLLGSSLKRTNLAAIGRALRQKRRHKPGHSDKVITNPSETDTPPHG